MRDGHVLISTYETVRIFGNMLMGREWGYVVLDEGHKIRNPGILCPPLLPVFPFPCTDRA